MINGRPIRFSTRLPRGLTLIECMILLVTLSIVAVAAGVGLQAVAKLPTQTDDILALNAAVIDRMEKMRAEPWSSMPAAAANLTNVNPGILVNNKYYPCTVTVADADPDGGGTETDFRQITVTVGSGGGVTMSVYVTQP